MVNRITAPVLSLMLALGGLVPAHAQEATPTEGTAAPAPAEAPATEAAPETPAIGTTYKTADFDAWEQRCVVSGREADPCQLYQLLKDTEGNSVAEVTFVPLANGGPAVAGASVVVPLETLLTEKLIIQIDKSEAKVYEFVYCARPGCVARVGFTAAEYDALKKGAQATLTIVPAAAPDKKVLLSMSLKGFTAGMDAVGAANVAADAAAAKTP